MNFVAVIFARGGSKGLPGKNIRVLGGKPLIAWSIDMAKRIKEIDRVFVSTDCSEIAAVSEKYGAEVPFLRPSELAGDKAAEWLAWQHFIQYCDDHSIEFDGMVSLPTTCPFRRPEHIQECLALFQSKNPDAVITVTDAHRHPGFNMVTLDEDIATVYDQSQAHTHRQSTSPVFDISTAVYVVRRDFIRDGHGLFSGVVMAKKADRFASIDIDTPFDFLLATALEPSWGQGDGSIFG